MGTCSCFMELGRLWMKDTVWDSGMKQRKQACMSGCGLLQYVGVDN